MMMAATVYIGPEHVQTQVAAVAALDKSSECLSLLDVIGYAVCFEPCQKNNCMYVIVESTIAGRAAGFEILKASQELNSTCCRVEQCIRRIAECVARAKATATHVAPTTDSAMAVRGDEALMPLLDRIIDYAKQGASIASDEGTIAFVFDRVSKFADMANLWQADAAVHGGVEDATARARSLSLPPNVARHVEAILGVARTAMGHMDEACILCLGELKSLDAAARTARAAFVAAARISDPWDAAASPSS